jgi:hypothetical protein
MPSKNEATAAAALAFVIPVSVAILEISSCLFMQPPERMNRAARSIRQPHAMSWCAPAVIRLRPGSVNEETRWTAIRGPCAILDRVPYAAFFDRM